MIMQKPIHPMRRKDKEITDPAKMTDIIEKGSVCRLAFWDGQEPYIVPMNYGYRDGVLYFHSAEEGRKVSLISAAPRVCFEITTDEEVIKSEQASKWTSRYRSVIGWGVAEEITAQEDKAYALRLLMLHYSGREEWSFPPEVVSRVMIFRVVIETMTAKQSRID